MSQLDATRVELMDARKAYRTALRQLDRLSSLAGIVNDNTGDAADPVAIVTAAAAVSDRARILHAIHRRWVRQVAHGKVETW